MTAPDRSTREQADAVPHKAAALLLAAAVVDRTLRAAAEQVQDALIAQDTEVRTLRAEDSRRQAVLDRQRGELGWARWLSRAAEKVRCARSGPGEAAAVAELIRALDTPRPSVESTRWSARDGGDCIRCDAPGPHVPLTSCRECGATWLRAAIPDGAPDGKHAPAQLDAAAEALAEHGLGDWAVELRHLAQSLRQGLPETRAAVAVALASPTGDER